MGWPDQACHCVVRLCLVSRSFVNCLLYTLGAGGPSRPLGLLSSDWPWDGLPCVISASTWVLVARAFDEIVLHDVILVSLSDLEDTWQYLFKSTLLHLFAVSGAL